MSSRTITMAVALAGLLTHGIHAQADSTIFEHDAAATQARAARNWPAYRYHVGRIDALMGGGQARVTVGLARGEARLGHTADAMALLDDFAATGLWRAIETDSDFVETLSKEPGWTALVNRLRRNREPAGQASLAFALPDSDFVAEDIAWDSTTGRTFVSSIRHAKVAVRDRQGRVRDFVPEGRDGIKGVLAVAVDRPHTTLWITSVGMPQTVGFAAADTGYAELVAYDLATGALRRKYPLPPAARHREAGDVAVARNGDVYIGDGAVGAVYAYRRETDSVETFIPPGSIISPQQSALSADQRTLYVADWARGIAAVDLASKSVRYLEHTRRVAPNGLDGLLWVRGKLIGVQNGADPFRVIELDLDGAGQSIASWKVLAQGQPWLTEPTHAVLAGCSLLAIGNSGFAAYDAQGVRLPAAKLDAPRVLRIPLAC